MVRENYYDLCMQMVDNGYQDRALQASLYEQMVSGTDRIELTTPTGVEPMFNDWVSYQLQFARYGSYYVWEQVRIGLQRNLPIQHTTIDGLDTAKLEQRMKPIDWLKDYADKDVVFKLMLKDQKDMMSEVRSIIQDLYKLLNSGSEHGIRIAIQLHQRYILPGPMGLKQGLHNSLLELAPLLTFDIDMQKNPFTLKMAYNLLCSRPVRKRSIDDNLAIKHQWYRLPLDVRGFGDPSQMIVEPDFDLSAELGKLHAKEFMGYTRHSSIKTLQAGDRLLIESPSGAVSVTVDPAIRSVYGIREDLTVMDLSGLIKHLNNTDKTQMPDLSSEQSLSKHQQRSTSKWKFRNLFPKGRKPGRS